MVHLLPSQYDVPCKIHLRNICTRTRKILHSSVSLQHVVKTPKKTPSIPVCEVQSTRHASLHPCPAQHADKGMQVPDLRLVPPLNT
jgi:hypothetical protein